VPGPIGEKPAYYVASGPSTYRPTRHAQGAWGSDQQHMGPISGLLARTVQACDPRVDLALSRLSFDILGVISLDEVTVRAEVSRPGRTIELVEATMTQHDRVVVRASAWRLLRTDTEPVAGTALATMPGPEDGARWDGTQTWSGGFIASLEIRVLPGWQPGRGRVWIRPTVPILDGTDVGDLPRFLGLVDTMNGVAVREDPAAVAFPNTDLTVHLFRHPRGAWLGLDVEVSFGPEGAGMTSAVLHDAGGPFGRALQVLTVRPLR
jgi:hypothetical protein